MKEDLQVDLEFLPLAEELGRIFSDVRSLVDTIVLTGLAIGLISVIYNVSHSSKTGKGQKAIISWLVAVFIYVIARSIV